MLSFLAWLLALSFAGDVGRLGHPDFRVREAATRRLERVGPLALPAVARAGNSLDPEVSARAERVRRHAWQGLVRFAVRAVVYGDPGVTGGQHSLPWASDASRWLVEGCPAVRRATAAFGRTLPGLEDCLFQFEVEPHPHPWMAPGLDNIRFVARGLPGAAKPYYLSSDVERMAAHWKQTRPKATPTSEVRP